MLTALLTIVAIAGGIWIGIGAPEGGKSSLKLLAAGVAVLVAAIVLYGLQCQDAQVADVFLLRDGDGYFCSGRLGLFAYMLFIAAPVPFIRSRLTKPMGQKD